MTMITRNNASALIPEQETREIIEGVVKQSVAMNLFRRLPNMSSGVTKMRVLDNLPLAYWQTQGTDGADSKKKLTNMAWSNKYIYAEELAVIVPISQSTLDDSEYDIWAEVRPRLIEAFGKKFDQAVFNGTDKPAQFRTDLINSIKEVGATITGTNSMYTDINNAMSEVELSGFNPTALVGGVDVKAKFRMLLDTTNQPIKGTEIDELPRKYVDNGSWDSGLAQFIVGDFSQAVYAIRQDITFDIFREGIIQDPSTGDILYNLLQQDMACIRAVMRIGWEIPNPINALNDTSFRFPFALVTPATIGRLRAKVVPGANTNTFIVSELDGEGNGAVKYSINNAGSVSAPTFGENISSYTALEVGKEITTSLANPEIVIAEAGADNKAVKTSSVMAVTKKK